jgi:toxin ParE1/3/4
MMLPVIRSAQAATDLRGILKFLQQRSPAAAQRLATKINERCERLGQFPGMGRPRDNLRPGLRSIAVEGYVILFQATPTAVEIVRILHGARNIDSIMQDDDS